MPRPFIPVPHTASIEMLYTWRQQVVENTFHVTKGSDWTLSDLGNMRNIFDLWHSGTLRLQQHSDLSLFRMKSRALHAANAPVEDFGLTTVRNGTITGGFSLPTNCTWAIKMVTGLSGRSYRGRNYILGLPSGSIVGNDIGSTVANAYIGIYNTILANLASPGYQLCVVSYKALGAWRTTGIATPVTGFAYSDLHLDSQRRRLTGRGL